MSMIFGSCASSTWPWDLVILASYLSFVTLSIFQGQPPANLVLVIPMMFLIGFIIQYYLVNRVVGQG